MAEPSGVGGDDWAGARGQRWRSNLDVMESMLAPIDAPLLEAARLDAPLRIADLACGGGGTTFKLLATAPAGSEVHGFDLSPALVEAALARRPEGAPQPVFSVADVSADPPPGRPYERLVSRFGMMFFEEPLAAFQNLQRWLKPGGRFAFAVWGPPAANPWMTLAREVVARHVELPAPQPDAPGPFRYGAPGTLPELLERSGFEDVQVKAWSGPLRLGGGLEAAAAARFTLDAFSFASPLREAGDEVRQRAVDALGEVFSTHLVEGQVTLGASVWIVTGRRPG